MARVNRLRSSGRDSVQFTQNINDLGEIDRWKQYIEQLFNHDRFELKIKELMIGPDIILYETERAIK